MLQRYVAAGLDPAEFWRITPRVFEVHLAGAVDRLEREQSDRAWLAWHIAALQRTKKLPRLRDLQPRSRPKTGAQSPAEMIAIARQWHAKIKAMQNG